MNVKIVTGIKICISVMVIPVLLCSSNSSTFGQLSVSPLTGMERHENALLQIIDHISNSSDNLERNEWNSKLIVKFQQVFSEPKAFSYPFDKLYAISDLKNKSGDLRIFTWELPNDQDIITYYGILCYNSDYELFTIILEDSSQSITNAEFTGLSCQRWYGAMYYDIREYTHKKNRFIVLLGINRSDELIKKTVIEILDLGEKIRFGKEVFDFPDRIVGIKRKIYQYSVEANMSIWFKKDEDLILLDHLSPLKSMYEGKFEFYAPDLSYDAFEFKKGKLHYLADYDAKMSKTDNDPLFEMDLPEQKKVY